MTLAQMVEELPTGGDVGTKRNAKGHQVSWTGYKLLHLDAADGGIPLSCMLTSASLHDSQVRDSPGYHDGATGDQSV